MWIEQYCDCVVVDVFVGIWSLWYAIEAQKISLCDSLPSLCLAAAMSRRWFFVNGILPFGLIRFRLWAVNGHCANYASEIYSSWFSLSEKLLFLFLFLCIVDDLPILLSVRSTSLPSHVALFFCIQFYYAVYVWSCAIWKYIGWNKWSSKTAHCCLLAANTFAIHVLGIIFFCCLTSFRKLQVVAPMRLWRHTQTHNCICKHTRRMETRSLDQNGNFHFFCAQIHSFIIFRFFVFGLAQVKVAWLPQSFRLTEWKESKSNKENVWIFVYRNVAPCISSCNHDQLLLLLTGTVNTIHSLRKFANHAY